MSHDETRLNIERAREALARARKDQVVASVRAPRPADLSRLQEEEARKQALDSRAGAFRDQVRERLSLGEYRGPAASASSYVSRLTGAPLCDADLCAPVRSDAFEARPAPIAEPRSSAQSSARTKPVRTRDGAPYTPVDLKPGETRSNQDAPKKRRKFLGIF
jgi:hypothetical protein